MTSFDFLKRFWAWSLSLLGLVGGYFALDQAEKGWLILPIAAGAAILASVRPAADSWAKIRRYPMLLSERATLQDELSTTRAELGKVEAAAADQFEQGAAYGRADVVGALLAAQVSSTPEMVAIGMSSGSLVITARPVQGTVAKGARFEVQVSPTGESKGAVEVTALDDGGEHIHMICVRRDVPQFWDALERRADEDPSPPRGVRLAPLPIGLPAELLPISPVERHGSAGAEAEAT